jgi:Fur family ferric uptake transcriptional regulator
LKCEECGALLHLECDLVNEIHRHILDRHTFQIDTTRTVFYGKCESCISRG